MNSIDINIDWMDRNFAASVADERIACIATGKTWDEAEHHIIDALRFHLQGMLENGDAIPPEYQSDWIPSFHLTTRAQLRYADAYITRKALARETGITMPMDGRHPARTPDAVSLKGSRRSANGWR